MMCIKKFLPLAILLLVAFPTVNAAQAESKRPEFLKCDTTTDVASLNDVLYKNQNIHGSRGRTFLDQDHRFHGTRTLLVAGTTGKVFSCFGLYRCDYPFGCRYYQATCGDRTSNNVFKKKTRSAGGSPIALVGTAKGGKCFSINTDTNRYGSVRK